MLERIAANGVRTIIVETANRFARDLMVQEVGWAILRDMGVSLVAVDSPQAFLDDGPTAKLVLLSHKAASGAFANHLKKAIPIETLGVGDGNRRSEGH
jgi:hypothetical protein